MDVGAHARVAYKSGGVERWSAVSNVLVTGRGNTEVHRDSTANVVVREDV